MQPQPAETSQSESSDPSAAASSAEAPQYVRHRKRPTWGLGALLWERDEKRSYRFEDGEVRSFKEGFFHFLDAVDPPKSMTSLEIQQLNGAENGQSSLPGLRDQLILFLHDYPGGFAGSKWLNARRGVGVRRALKRHREPVMATAARVLSLKNIDKRRADGEHTLLWDEVTDLISKTDLVPTAHSRGLAKLPPGTALSDALRTFLHGEEPDVTRFDALRRAIGSSSWTWPLATTLLALYRPLTDVPIRPSVFGLQAKALALTISAGTTPSARAYRSYVALACHVRDWLVAHEIPPKDLIDVHDFIWATLRPAARKRISAGGFSEEAIAAASITPKSAAPAAADAAPSDAGDLAADDTAADDTAADDTAADTAVADAAASVDA